MSAKLPCILAERDVLSAMEDSNELKGLSMVKILKLAREKNDKIKIMNIYRFLKEKLRSGQVVASDGRYKLADQDSSCKKKEKRPPRCQKKPQKKKPCAKKRKPESKKPCCPPPAPSQPKPCCPEPIPPKPSCPRSEPKPCPEQKKPKPSCSKPKKPKCPKAQKPKKPSCPQPKKPKPCCPSKPCSANPGGLQEGISHMASHHKTLRNDREPVPLVPRASMKKDIILPIQLFPTEVSNPRKLN